MSTLELLTIWPDQPVLSAIILILVGMILMYFARHPAHTAIYALSVAIRKSLRLASKSVALAEQKLKERNREVLLAAGREACERYLEREFQRVETMVMRDLSGYPSLQRELKEQIAQIDEDYQRSADVPPSPPNWLKAVDSVAKIPTNGDPMVAKILGDISVTLTNAHNTAMQEYRNASRERHLLLKKMMPYWRGVAKTLDNVEQKISGLEERSNIIDRQMEKYEQILAKTDQAERTLSSSSLTQFFISGIVLLIAVMGAFINFQLIALPMSEMVGGTSVLIPDMGNFGPIRTADVAALVIIFVEVAMGLFLMESLHITRLFPVISSMDDKMRKRMLWITFGILLALASIESALAYMRDLLASDKEALNQSLAGIPVAMPEFRWIPSLGQMVMGFILPFALTFVAIPLESFIHSSRTVVGVLIAAFLRSLAFFIRFLGNFIYNLGGFMVNIYDLLVFIPLRIELSLKSRKEETKQEKPEEDQTVSPLVSRISKSVRTTDGART